MRRNGLERHSGFRLSGVIVSLHVWHGGLDGAVYKCIVMHRKKYIKVRCIQLHVSTHHCLLELIFSICPGST